MISECAPSHRFEILRPAIAQSRRHDLAFDNRESLNCKKIYTITSATIA
jgi:hypothetical protein